MMVRMMDCLSEYLMADLTEKLMEQRMVGLMDPKMVAHSVIHLEILLVQMMEVWRAGW